MPRQPRTIITAVLLALGFVSVFAQSPAREFEIASIKRNIDPMPPSSGTMQNTPKGEIRLVWIPARVLVLRAYPLEMLPAEVVGLPSWADSERYDVTVKGRPDATSDELRQMWRTLLANRMKLAAHYEPRDVRGYKLVVARSDGKLGPELKPSKLDCPTPDPAKPTPPPMPSAMGIRPGSAITPETERRLMSLCYSMMTFGNTTYAGAVPMFGLVMTIRSGGIREPVEDQTGLAGLYSFKLTFSEPTLGAQTPDDAPSIFSALQEQLGLKLERATIRSQAVVVDQIERPSEN